MQIFRNVEYFRKEAYNAINSGNLADATDHTIKDKACKSMSSGGNDKFNFKFGIAE